MNTRLQQIADRDAAWTDTIAIPPAIEDRRFLLSELLKARAALEEIDKVALVRAEGGPSDMSDQERNLLLAFGKCLTIARQALGDEP